tara:strand:+ start:50 stop:442 length:393 start_codon:yes stop_codon:yes gene_type:complete
MDDVGIALITEGNKALITQRRAEDSFPSYWEFPGGRCEEGESPQDCVIREMLEELEITVGIEGPGPEVVHQYPDGTIRLISFWCKRLEGEPVTKEAVDLCWVQAGELSQYRFPPASETLIEAVREKLNHR